MEVTALCACFLPVVRGGFCSVKEKIVGNAPGLRHLTVSFRVAQLLGDV